MATLLLHNPDYLSQKDWSLVCRVATERLQLRIHRVDFVGSTGSTDASQSICWVCTLQPGDDVALRGLARDWRKLWGSENVVLSFGTLEPV